RNACAPGAQALRPYIDFVEHSLRTNVLEILFFGVPLSLKFNQLPSNFSLQIEVISDYLYLIGGHNNRE
ncbi:hypothetical protein, partial [Oscillatoria sp. HE19RPO]|uniref:hypothetical protein n=1 Tax=Oscillatoria sp. HE19RPO TaxID=2954806 RepID=UPI0020C4715B